MKLILCIFLLPCLYAVKVQNIVCPDGKECPLGKTCCGPSSGAYECCDLSEEARKNYKLIPASFSRSTSNVSYSATHNVQPELSGCPALQCGAFCCPYAYGTCCRNPMYCCERGRCCSNYYSQQPWCCEKKDRCHTEYGYCLAGASSISVTILSLVFAFVFAVTTKYLL